MAGEALASPRLHRQSFCSAKQNFTQLTFLITICFISTMKLGTLNRIISIWLQVCIHHSGNGACNQFFSDDPKKTEHLLALDGAKERLHFFQADLLEEGSFDPIVDGCEGVFHTASPVHFSVSDPQGSISN
ncbi:hypothetical protein CsSME_00011604 [Camellia sinensis var. sinensis]